MSTKEANSRASRINSTKVNEEDDYKARKVFKVANQLDLKVQKR